MQHSFKTTNPLPLPAKPSQKWNITRPTQKERCSLSSLALRDSGLMSMVDPLPLNQTKGPWNPPPRRTWQTHQPGCSACYCTSRAMLHYLLLPQQGNGPAQYPLSLQSTSWPQHSTGYCHSSCLPVSRLEGSILTSLHE